MTDLTNDVVEHHAQRIAAATGSCLSFFRHKARRAFLSAVLDCYEAGYRAASEGHLSALRSQLDREPEA